MPKTWNNERPMFIERQKERPDLDASRRKEYWNGNVFLTFHGTRAVNVPASSARTCASRTNWSAW
jgi:hypothetical protein